MAPIRTTLVYVFIGLYLLIMAPLGMAWTFLTKDAAFIYHLARFCVRIAGLIGGVRVRIAGTEKLHAGQNYVFLSNHQGNCDGPVLLHAIPRDFRALIKKEMMRIPILSLVMRQVHFVPIDRSDPVKARASIDYGARLLSEGYSFIAFPEGTRSRDGSLGTFKKGVFIMALQAHTPVVPISIVNSSRIQPRGAYSIRPGTVGVVFHDPIITSEMSIADRERLVDLTRSAILSSLSKNVEESALKH